MKVSILSIQLNNKTDIEEITYRILYQVGCKEYEVLITISPCQVGNQTIRVVKIPNSFWETIDFNGIIAMCLKDLLLASEDVLQTIQLPIPLGELSDVYVN